MTHITDKQQLDYLIEKLSSLDEGVLSFYFDIDTDKLTNLNHIEYDVELRKQLTVQTSNAIKNGDIQ